MLWCCAIVESNNNQKLMLEYEKYQELQLKSQKMQEDYERQLQEMEESRERALEELQEQYEAKIRELRSQLDTVGTIVHYYAVCLCGFDFWAFY